MTTAQPTIALSTSISALVVFSRAQFGDVREIKLKPAELLASALSRFFGSNFIAFIEVILALYLSNLNVIICMSVARSCLFWPIFSTASLADQSLRASTIGPLQQRGSTITC